MLLRSSMHPSATSSNIHFAFQYKQLEKCYEGLEGETSSTTQPTSTHNTSNRTTTASAAAVPPLRRCREQSSGELPPQSLRPCGSRVLSLVGRCHSKWEYAVLINSYTLNMYWFQLLSLVTRLVSDALLRSPFYCSFYLSFSSSSASSSSILQTGSRSSSTALMM